MVKRYKSESSINYLIKPFCFKILIAIAYQTYGNYSSVNYNKYNNYENNIVSHNSMWQQWKHYRDIIFFHRTFLHSGYNRYRNIHFRAIILHTLYNKNWSYSCYGYAMSRLVCKDRKHTGKCTFMLCYYNNHKKMVHRARNVLQKLRWYVALSKRTCVFAFTILQAFS